MPRYTLQLNNRACDVVALADMPLLWVLRDQLEACTVQLNGVTVRSCQVPVATAVGIAITTNEGLDSEDSHPLRMVCCEPGVAKCAYCQAGQIMAAALLRRTYPCPGNVIEGGVVGDLRRCIHSPETRRK
jgi:isoquinoline 1-oxidoreductase subunit alpha